ncbi:MAG: thermonuclease family protein [candidate division Zixibacteria bacterium]|nr:thermonuclease family protein [candidate division Zixibacteria bacterium]
MVHHQHLFCKILLSIIILIYCVILFGCGDEREAPYYDKNILDGDTFITDDSITVRLIGIDTPEKGDKFAEEATELLSRLLDRGNVRLEYGQQRFDKYGRTLAYVYVDSAFVNKAMLDSGLAVVYFHKPNLKYFNEFIDSQKKARLSELNIWSESVGRFCDYYGATKNSYRFHCPDCGSIRGRDSSSIRVFKDRNEALDLGLSPCRNCRP